MLNTLRIKNLGLVKDLTLEFDSGFTALTGETGAGKSMIMGALNLIMGQRADRRLIRSGEDGCLVEAVFDLSNCTVPVNDFLAENGFEACDHEQLFLKRSVTAAGSNRQFINHSPASLSLLGTLGASLIDIHGPYDHQSLFDTQKQLALLDAFAGLNDTRKRYSQGVNHLRDLAQQKADLIVDDQAYAQQLDLLRFQTREIATARLDQLDEETLEDDYHQAQNAAQIRELGQGLLDITAQHDQSLVTTVAQLGQGLHQLVQLDPRAAALLDQHAQITEMLDDLNTQLNQYLDQVDVDPSHLMTLEEQINQLQSLKRKYGASVDAIQRFGIEAQAKLDTLESRDTEVARLDEAIAHGLTQLATQGQALSKQRRQAAKALANATAEQLEDLGFLESRFTIDFEPRTAPYDSVESLHLTGDDQIEFQFGPNPGEPLLPLRKIASSGEIARAMLAIKTVLAAQDRIPLLIFDEIDANVGGETAHTVGEKMRLIGESHQVVCITHLAPVAAAANAHWQVTKSAQDDRTLTDVAPLSRAERIGELARMLGGKLAAAKKHAAALLKSQQGPA